MAVRPTNEFNAFGVASQDMQLRLLSLAQSGNTAIHSVFSAAADAEGLTERGRQAIERRRERTIDALRLATQEQMAAMQQRLDRLERASYEALIEADDKRRNARRDLDQLRERAFAITMPDGSTVRVYRDGEDVRQESGELVGHEAVRAEDIPDHAPTWQERQAQARAFEEAERRHREIVEYRERLDRARSEIGSGSVTAERAQELDADIEAMPDSIRERLDGVAPPEQRVEITQPSPAASRPSLR